MNILDQGTEFRVIQDVKKVQWLIDNSDVKVFNPLDFNEFGYQRELEDKHWKKIVKYIEDDSFFFPTAIICACDIDYDENIRLRIVDGQHRIKALREIKETNSEKYEKIKNKELPIIVLEKISHVKEIETFININKKGKKVDTSLATVLNHFISDKDDLKRKKAKIEYIAVEIATELSLEENGIWENQICFEGNAKRHNQLISINAFVRSTQYLLSTLETIGILKIDWGTENELIDCKAKCIFIVKTIWKCVVQKWPELFSNNIGANTIIQGPIGYSSVNKFIVFYLKENPINNIDIFLKELISLFSKINIDYKKWLQNESTTSYSNFSSEAGYTIIAKDLLDSIRK